MANSKKTADAGKSATKKGPRTEAISSKDLPKKTLEDALKVAQAIKDNYGKQATWQDIASAMGFSPNNPNNQYYLWSATAYGIIDKDADDNYKITETGRKILAATYDGEDREGAVKAISNPIILGRFYSDYSASQLPSGDIFKNVLEQKYGIPKSRVDETINLILANARFAKLLEEQADGKPRLKSANAAVGVGESELGLATSPVGADAAVAAAAAGESATDYGKACFIITPIGEEGTPERKHADAMLRHLISPVLEQFNLNPVRADKISKPGHITKQVVENIAFCKLCITDLSFGNQNAHYELGIRHTLKLASIQLIRKGDKIPFDVQQSRTIVIDTSDPYTIMDRLESAKAELSEHVKAILEEKGKHQDSPITMYLPNLVVKIG
jgi:hypothetical protein